MTRSEKETSIPGKQLITEERFNMRYKAKILLWSFIFVCLFASLPDSAQAYTGKLQIPPAGDKQMITLDDGSILVGRITNISESEVRFETEMGEMTIQIAKIKEIKELPASSIKGGKYWFPNPNRTRLFWGPTARTLQKGDGYLFDLWIFFPGIAYGITDNIMVTGGASIVPGADAEDQLYYLSPKVGFAASDKLDVAFNFILFHLWDESFYFAMANSTYGTDDNSLTGGLGIAFDEEEMADNPVATLGAEYRLGRRVAAVGETWFIPGETDSGVLGIVGLRLMGEQLTVDFGIGFATEADQSENEFEDDSATNWIPYVDFVWNF